MLVQEPASQDRKPWTRFVFNNDALLEEEGAAGDSPSLEGNGQAGLGAFDFRQHRAAKPGKSAEDAHEVLTSTTLCIVETVVLAKQVCSSCISFLDPGAALLHISSVFQ